MGADGTITCGRDPVQSAIDDYIIHTAQSENGPVANPETSAAVEIMHADSGLSISAEIQPVNHDVIS